MSRKISLLFVFLFIAASAFAVMLPGEEEYTIPHRISNNEFFLESLRLTSLALDTYDFGDYDASTGFAEEAIRFAELSNEFVAVQLIAEASRLLTWAQANGLDALHPFYYNEGRIHYEISVTAHSDGDLEHSIASAIRAIQILSILELPVVPPAPGDDGISPLPRQYTVRTWANERDCLWNIAAYPWVFGDPWRWRELYEANRERMPEPNNPDLIHPGFILEIPSIRGEHREGMWDPNKTYRP